MPSPKSPSLRARLLNGLLRIAGVKRRAEDLAFFTKLVRRGQAAGPSQPGRRRERRLRIGREEFGGCSVFTAAPREGGSRHHILYLHGGAYVFDLAGLHWRVIEDLIRRTGASVTVPIYPLAPRATWREALGMVRPLHAALAARHGADNLTVAGDSAGGGMALALAQILRDAGEALPARLVLLSPWLDATMADPGQIATDPQDPFLALAPGRLAAAWYAGDLPVEDPRISPINGGMDGLPPMLVLTGTRDLLNADAHRLHAKATAAGGTVVLRDYPGMIHVWMLMPLPEARTALDEVEAFMGAAPPAG